MHYEDRKADFLVKPVTVHVLVAVWKKTDKKKNNSKYIADHLYEK